MKNTIPLVLAHVFAVLLLVTGLGGLAFAAYGITVMLPDAWSQLLAVSLVSVLHLLAGASWLAIRRWTSWPLAMLCFADGAVLTLWGLRQPGATAFALCGVALLAGVVFSTPEVRGWRAREQNTESDSPRR